MIISKTPYRISFFGGGSDYPDWYLKNGGEVLSTTIDKYLYLCVKKLPNFFNYNYKITYSKIENVNTIDQIKHSAVREFLKRNFAKSRYEINCISDLPARSGIGSSSTFSVGLINAVSFLEGKKLSKKKLYQKAIELERDHLNENVGSQDQVATACGGMNNIIFHKSGEIKVKKLELNKKRLKSFQDRFILMYTGQQRKASTIAKEHINVINKENFNMQYFSDLAKEAKNILVSNRNLDEIGELLDLSWKKKKEISAKISNSLIDEYYLDAKKNGVIGGKILGAGGGGFLLLYCSPNHKEKILRKLNYMQSVDFNFEKKGSHIINY